MAIAQVHQSIVLQPRERLDSIGGRILQQQVAAIVAEEHNLWVIDMALVDFVDSSGLFALVYGLRLARDQGCRLVLCNVKATARLIFEITQLDRVFEIFENYDVFMEMLERSAKPSLNISLLAA